MRKPHAQWLTVHKADIDRDTSIEILWQTAPNTLHLLLFRFSLGTGRATLTTEELGPYRSLAELRQQLSVLFGELTARRICQHPSSWLPRTILDYSPHRRPRQWPASKWSLKSTTEMIAAHPETLCRCKIRSIPYGT